MSRVKKTEHGWMVFCPGCQRAHHVPDDGRWQFDGNLDNPTFSPSLLVQPAGGSGPEREQQVCHAFIQGGHWQFLSDCTHALSGQTVPVPEWGNQW